MFPISNSIQNYNPAFEQIYRQQTLRKYCSTKGRYIKLNKDNEVPFRLLHTLLFSEKLSVIFCSVPKTSSSNWKRLMLVFGEKIKDPSQTGNDVRVHGYTFNQLNKLQRHESKKMLAYFYTFCFVKHPYKRLVSAWRNKFNDLKHANYLLGYKAKILREFRKNLTEEEYDSGWGVTFEEFTSYMVKVYKTRPVLDYFDEHWRPATSLCYPCQIKYNFIGKMETLIEDSRHVMQVLNVQNEDLFPVDGGSHYAVKTELLVEEYFSKFSNETLSDLYKMYEADFEAFGFDLPNTVKQKMRLIL